MNVSQQESDPFCEIEFWRSVQGAHPAVTNPVDAATGVLMACIACVPILDASVATGRVPFVFFVAKAAIFVTGAGTAVFHSVSLQYDSLNIRALDWIPIVLMGFTAILLFVAHDLTRASETGTVAVCAGSLLWMVANIVLMDSGTRPRLAAASHDDALTWVNAFLLLPFLLIVGRMLSEPTMRAHMLPGGVLTAASVTLWAINSALCRAAPWLFVFHAVYHLTIAVAYIHLVTIATAFVSQGYLEVRLVGPLALWPRLSVSGAAYEEALELMFN